MCLTYLPKMAREGIHFASCSHISNVMTETLLDNKKVGDKTPKTITTTIYCNYLLLLQTISNKLCRCWAVIAIARESIHHIFNAFPIP